MLGSRRAASFKNYRPQLGKCEAHKPNPRHTELNGTRKLPRRVLFGDRFVQIGAFRLGAVDGAHFSISHRNGATMVIYRSAYATDPHPVHPGVRWDWGLWGKGHSSKNPALSPMGITFGDRFVQIGNFRLGQVDKDHFSVAHAGTGKTLQVFRSNGHHFGGPRDDYTTLGRSLEQCKEMEP